LFGSSFDNGSYDGCGDIKIEIRREQNDPSCFNIGNNDHNNNSTYSSDSFGFPYNSDDTDNGEFVKFCCEDLSADGDGDGIADGLVKVWLRITDELGNYSESWSFVRVESKLAPIIVCPPSLIVDCYEDLEDYAAIGLPTITGICGVDTLEWIEEMIDTEAREKPAFVEPLIDIDNDGTFDKISAFDPACSKGALRRRFNFNGTVVCEQWIVVETINDFDPLLIDWPYDKEGENEAGDVTLLPDNNNPTYSEVLFSCVDEFDQIPEWVDATCSLIGFNMESDTFYFEADACQKIINKYTVIDWCNYEVNFNDPDGDLNGNGIQDGIWTWTVIGKLIDTYNPVVTAMDTTFAVSSGSGGSNGGINCTGSGFSVSATAADLFVDINGDTIADACPSQWLKWNVYLDLNNDWVFEREWSSFVAEDRNTSTDPLWSEDNAVDNLATYGYEIPDVRVGNRGDVDNAGNFATPPGFEYTINIPDEILADCGEKEHRVVWKVYDGCGNQASVTSYFKVTDQKAPTPVCINLSTALMIDGNVELWACDFDLGSSDNCTAIDNLRFTFSDLNPEADPEYRPDLKCSSKTFTTDDLNGESMVVIMLPIYVWDDCGNYDYCEVELRIVDDAQGNFSSPIAGDIETKKGESLDEVSVTLESNHPEYPKVAQTVNGVFNFDNNPNNFDYQISAEKNNDFLNGVSTIDLIFIQRHILGLQPFDSPYKYIAGDVNNDNDITAIDLVELRKLILGINDDFPDNESWRFINRDVGVTLSNPFIFDETYYISDLDRDRLFNDFTAIKVGDINESVIANVSGKSSETRADQDLELFYEVDKKLNSNQVIVPIYLRNIEQDIFGLQFTLELNNSNLVDIDFVSGNLSKNNFGIFKDKLTFSYFENNGINFTEGKPLFNLILNVNNADRNDLLNMTSSVTQAEAYVTSDLEIFNLKLDREILESEFVLYQNEPNPFNEYTVIRIDSPEDSDLTLNVFDANSRLIKKVNQKMAVGENYITLNKSDLPVSGIYYYDIIANGKRLRKRLIHID
ncbi:MAG: T9SS type A sorting domain-containing protein, partial [Bacteroidia bacterium]|nr:T9SS type A sorting domain-containing protein [Bacteroidia bacterium]